MKGLVYIIDIRPHNGAGVIYHWWAIIDNQSFQNLLAHVREKTQDWGGYQVSKKSVVKS